MYLTQPEIEEIIAENSELKNKIRKREFTIIQIVLIVVVALGIYFMCVPTKSDINTDVNNKEIQELKSKIEHTELERDLLSDAIRSHIDRTDGECDILKEVDYFLNIKDESLRDFDKWYYCY